jgi:hypothetical protein
MRPAADTDDLDDDLDSSPRPILGAASCPACGHVPVAGHRAVVWPAELLGCPCSCHASWRLAWQLPVAE